MRALFCVLFAIAGISAVGKEASANDACALIHYQPYTCDWGVLSAPSGSVTVSDPTFSQVAWISCGIVPQLTSDSFCFRACGGTSFTLDFSDLEFDFNRFQIQCTNQLNNQFGSSWTGSMYASCISKKLNGPSAELSCIGGGDDGGGGVIP